MAKKRTAKKKPQKKKTARRDWRERLSFFTSPAGRTATIATGWVILIGSIAGAWFFGVPWVQNATAEQLQPTRIELIFRDKPPWMKDDRLVFTELNALRGVTGEPFHRGDLERIRENLLGLGWFDAITQVQRVSPTEIVVDAEFVNPVAVVRDFDGDHLVDGSGKLLPLTFPLDTSQLTIIVGAAFDRPTRIGMQWDGSDINAALQLLNLIDSDSCDAWRHQVAAIDVTNYAAEQSLAIVTDRGTRIIWGSAPGQESTGEATAERKLTYLNNNVEHSSSGHIDRGHNGDIILTSPNGVFAPRTP